MRQDCTAFAERLAALFGDIIFKTMTVSPLREMEELDVTLSQLQGLTFIAEHPGCSVGQLAHGLGVSHPAAVKTVEKLVARSLVSRAQSANDQRQAVLQVTPAGSRVAQRLHVERSRRLEQVLGRMPESERRQLIRGLESFVAVALESAAPGDRICTQCQTAFPSDCPDGLPTAYDRANRQLLTLAT